MGVMKRIATEMAWNPTLHGAATSPEIAAMKRLLKTCSRKTGTGCLVTVISPPVAVTLREGEPVQERRRKQEG